MEGRVNTLNTRVAMNYSEASQTSFSFVFSFFLCSYGVGKLLRMSYSYE